MMKRGQTWNNSPCWIRDATPINSRIKNPKFKTPEDDEDDDGDDDADDEEIRRRQCLQRKWEKPKLRKKRAV